jgi:hypothetical protein
VTTGDLAFRNAPRPPPQRTGAVPLADLEHEQLPDLIEEVVAPPVHLHHGSSAGAHAVCVVGQERAKGVFCATLTRLVQGVENGRQKPAVTFTSREQGGESR